MMTAKACCPSVEAQQEGAERAAYRQAVLKTLSLRLSAEFGSGFSSTALKHMHGFFQAYPQLLDSGHAPRDLLAEMPEAPPLGSV